MADHRGKEWPVTGSVYWRESTGEWVLEIIGVINGCDFVSRHTQPENIAPQDVAGLPTLYEPHP